MPVEQPVMSTAFEIPVVAIGADWGTTRCRVNGCSLNPRDAADSVRATGHGLQEHAQSAAHRVPDARQSAAARAGDPGAMGADGALPPDAGGARRQAAL